MKERDGRGELGAPLLRVAIGFVIGLLFWTGFRTPYESFLATASESLLRLAERPPVTRLEARNGEILVDRRDFPPAAPKPGLPAADLHFNFVLLVALFALDRRPWRAERMAALLAAGAALVLVHVLALCLEVESLYATRLGAWSETHYSVFARNVWAAGFHFYQIAGRFAAPFVLWWPFSRLATEREDDKKRRARRS